MAERKRRRRLTVKRRRKRKRKRKPMVRRRKPPRGKPRKLPKRSQSRRKRKLPRSRRPSSPLSPPTRLRLPRPNKLRVYSLFCIPNQSQSLSEFILLSKQNSSFRIVPRNGDDDLQTTTECVKPGVSL